MGALVMALPSAGRATRQRQRFGHAINRFFAIPTARYGRGSSHTRSAIPSCGSSISGLAQKTETGLILFSSRRFASAPGQNLQSDQATSCHPAITLLCFRHRLEVTERLERERLETEFGHLSR